MVSSAISKAVILLTILVVTSSETMNQTLDTDDNMIDFEASVQGSEMESQMLLSTNRSQTTTKRHLNVVTIEIPPFMMRRSNNTLTARSNSTDAWYGYCIDFFHELIKHLPYEVTYEIYQVSDNKFGTKSKQIVTEKDNTSGHKINRKIERWNGLIGDLHQGKADLALAPLAVMAERELVMDFTVPFYDLVGIQILMKKPEVPKDWFKFLTVLDGEVWLSITVAYFATSFVIYLFDRLSPYSHKNLSRIKKMRRDRRSNNDSATTSSSRAIGDTKDISLISSGINTKGFNLKVNPQLDGLKESEFIESPSRRFHLIDSIESKPSSHFPKIWSTDTAKKVDSTSSWQVSNRMRRASGDYLRSIEFIKNFNALEPNNGHESESDDGKPDFGLRDSLWFCITSLTPQGGGEAPQNLSGRIVAGAWWLFCFIVIASYTANLAAFLTVSRLDIPIESLDDLAKQYRIKYAPVDGTAEQTYFERMAYIEEIFYNIWKQMSLNDSLSEEERSKFAVWDYPISDKYTKIWAQIQQVGMPMSHEDGVLRVKGSTLGDGFALISNANMVKHAVMTDCSLKVVGDEFSRKPVALGVRKGDDQLREDLSYAILQLINQRFMEVLREKWWTNNPKRVICDSGDESEGISIQNIGGVFIIIFVGVILSYIAWAMEKHLYKTKLNASKELIKHY